MQLIVLVHGMWGNARDFKYMVSQMESRGIVEFCSSASKTTPTAASDALNDAQGIVYCGCKNEGYYTYDGVDICGIRLAGEIRDILKQLHDLGVKITGLSIVGFSMGGLIARYAIGVLEARGTFNPEGALGHPQIVPMTFVATCSPHVGTNILGSALSARIFNFVGSWSMARTSRQCFLRDTDQPNKLPLFLLMTQPETIWTRALARFNQRLIYANVANDRRCEFYTAGVNKQDPYSGQNLDQLSGPYVFGYEPVVLSAENPTFRSEQLSDSGEANEETSLLNHAKQGRVAIYDNTLVKKLSRLGKLIYLVLRVGIVLPLWFCAFLINAQYQYIASAIRSRPHSTIEFDDMLQSSAEDMVETIYGTVQKDPEDETTSNVLQLTPVMHQIITNFEKLNFQKFYLRILATPMAHSAAIVRFERLDWHEGKKAVEHLLNAIL